MSSRHEMMSSGEELPSKWRGGGRQREDTRAAVCDDEQPASVRAKLHPLGLMHVSTYRGHGSRAHKHSPAYLVLVSSSDIVEMTRDETR